MGRIIDFTNVKTPKRFEITDDGYHFKDDCYIYDKVRNGKHIFCKVEWDLNTYFCYSNIEYKYTEVIISSRFPNEWHDDLYEHVKSRIDESLPYGYSDIKVLRQEFILDSRLSYSYDDYYSLDEIF